MPSPLGLSWPIVPFMPCIGDLEERTFERLVVVRRRRAGNLQLWLVPSGEVTRLGSCELSKAEAGFVFVRCLSSPDSNELLPNPLEP
jgi:hypothetical protein